ncbi:MAG: DUF5320 domain-containing protein [Planctomycetes bacterium]|nr:DUF5320 domain-containing protein [Planctomycetota bacterium]
MPRGDGTGPAGMGPMTGRAAGYCAGYSVPGYANPGGGRGFGRGGGWGRRNRFYATGLTGWQRAAAGVPPYGGVPPVYAPPTKEQELGFLKDEAEGLQGALSDITKRIEKLEAEGK